MLCTESFVIFWDQCLTYLSNNQNIQLRRIEIPKRPWRENHSFDKLIQRFPQCAPQKRKLVVGGRKVFRSFGILPDADALKLEITSVSNALWKKGGANFGPIIEKMPNNLKQISFIVGATPWIPMRLVRVMEKWILANYSTLRTVNVRNGPNTNFKHRYATHSSNRGGGGYMVLSDYVRLCSGNTWWV